MGIDKKWKQHTLQGFKTNSQSTYKEGSLKDFVYDFGVTFFPSKCLKERGINAPPPPLNISVYFARNHNES